jgi:ferric-dicitrate binding protein FerR (iron transport regulator)
MLEDNLEASPQHATAYFAMASGLREAAAVLSLLLNQPATRRSPEPARSAHRRLSPLTGSSKGRRHHPVAGGAVGLCGHGVGRHPRW